MNRELRSTIIAGAVFTIVALIALYFVNERKTELEAVNAEITTLEQAIEALKAKVATLPALQEELQSIEENLANYIKILPSPLVATEERLMDLVQEKCERAQFFFVSYQTKDTRAGKQATRSAFKEIDITLNATGTYEQFLNFLNSLERHETFLRVNSFSCKAPKEPVITEEGDEEWPLNVALNISTFRYEAGK